MVWNHTSLQGSRRPSGTLIDEYSVSEVVSSSVPQIWPLESKFTYQKETLITYLNYSQAIAIAIFVHL